MQRVPLLQQHRRMVTVLAAALALSAHPGSSFTSPFTSSSSSWLHRWSTGLVNSHLARPPVTTLSKVRRPSSTLAEPVMETQAAGVPGTVVDIAGGGRCDYLLNTVEKARTVASSCSTGTFCTSCAGAQMGAGFPFGSHVDYVLDSDGWPVMLLNDQSMHTVNIMKNPRASLFAQMPSTVGVGQPPAAMARVTVMGEIVPVEDQDELYTLRATYSVTHGFAAMLVESDKFKFMKLKPEKIYYVGGFGVNSQWVDVEDYEKSTPDPIALESLELANKLTDSKQDDLRLLCSQFIGLTEVDEVVVTTIDRLGMDIRVTHKVEDEQQRTEVFRLGFQVNVRNLEESKSEILKMFQEAWEKSEGEEWEDMGPPVFKTSTDILN